MVGWCECDVCVTVRLCESVRVCDVCVFASFALPFDLRPRCANQRVSFRFRGPYSARLPPAAWLAVARRGDARSSGTPRRRGASSPSREAGGGTREEAGPLRKTNHNGEHTVHYTVHWVHGTNDISKRNRTEKKRNSHNSTYKHLLEAVFVPSNRFDFFSFVSFCRSTGRFVAPPFVSLIMPIHMGNEGHDLRAQVVESEQAYAKQGKEAERL